MELLTINVFFLLIGLADSFEYLISSSMETETSFENACLPLSGSLAMAVLTRRLISVTFSEFDCGIPCFSDNSYKILSFSVFYRSVDFLSYSICYSTLIALIYNGSVGWIWLYIVIIGSLISCNIVTTYYYYRFLSLLVTRWSTVVACDTTIYFSGGGKLPLLRKRFEPHATPFDDPIFLLLFVFLKHPFI